MIQDINTSAPWSQFRNKTKIKTLRRAFKQGGTYSSTYLFYLLYLSLYFKKKKRKERAELKRKNKMSSTSLSRQLEQLRASSQVSKYQLSKDDGVSVASLGPNILDVQLGGEQLLLLAKEAVNDLSLICPIIGSFKSLIFKDDPDDLTCDDLDELVDDEKKLEDLLLFLTPYLLKKSTQYLMQYLITKHKIHHNYAEVLFFSTLPFYEYSIFNLIVEAIPNQFAKSQAEEEYPKWAENFRQACHPATLVGLTRHLASNPGFFKFFCQIFTQKILRSHVKRYIYLLRNRP